MLCMRCDHENSEGARFCGNCGNNLAAAKVKKCLACGSELKPGEKICGACAGKISSKKDAAIHKYREVHGRAHEMFFRALPNLLHCPPVSLADYYLGVVRGLLVGLGVFAVVSIFLAELLGGATLAAFIGVLAGMYALLRVDGHRLVGRAVEVGLPNNKPLVWLGVAGVAFIALGGLLHFSLAIIGLLCLFGLALVVGMQEEKFQ